MSDGQIAASAGTGQPSPKFQPIDGGLVKVGRILPASGDAPDSGRPHEFSNLVGGPHYLPDGSPDGGSPPSDPRDGVAARGAGGLHRIARITPESGDGQGS